MVRDLAHWKGQRCARRASRLRGCGDRARRKAVLAREQDETSRLLVSLSENPHDDAWLLSLAAVSAAVWCSMSCSRNCRCHSRRGQSACRIRSIAGPSARRYSLAALHQSSVMRPAGRPSLVLPSRNEFMQRKHVM